VAAEGLSAPVVEAAIDIGSNSVHLLVGLVTDLGVTPLADESALLGLGDVVDAEGRLPWGARLELLEALAAQAEVARRWHARDLVLLGTEPLRRAVDRDEIAAAVIGRIGCRLDVLTHAEEAELTLLGVTRGARVPDQLLVLDIGGSSSEWVVVGPGTAPATGVLPSGSRRLTATCAIGDPPSIADLDRLRTEATRLAAASIAAPPVERAILTGGSATNLAKALAALGDAPVPMLTRAGVKALLGSLAAVPSVEVAERFRVSGARARMLPAGAALVLALFDVFGLYEAAVSDASLREGAVLALASAGGDWRERLSPLTHGWRPAPAPTAS
jgi:exopolyphosphatase/guanosine-5'-triphosphate,3'-diphosphate pyrophosphatase